MTTPAVAVNRRTHRIRVEVLVLLALVIQSVLLGFWGGQLTRASHEHDNKLERLESFHIGAIQ